jgi:hypothetical protein
MGEVGREKWGNDERKSERPRQSVALQGEKACMCIGLRYSSGDEKVYQSDYAVTAGDAGGDQSEDGFRVGVSVDSEMVV